MNKNKLPLRSNHGMVMMITIFLLLIIMPVLLILARWMRVHQKGTSQARVHIKEYYNGDGGVNVINYLIRSATAGCPGTNCWDQANTLNTVYTDSGTVVTINMTNVGTP